MDKIIPNFNTIEDFESCPCGSDKLFVNCCKNNTSKSKKNGTDKFKNDKHINQWIRKKYKSANISVCLHPVQLECNGPIIGAHVLQNNGVLSKLAVDGHVNIISIVAQKLKVIKKLDISEEQIQDLLMNSSEKFAKELNEQLKKIEKKDLKELYGKRIWYEEESYVLKYVIERKGKNEATKFTGFCNYHDTTVFNPIEKYKYNNEIEQDFLFAYRAFAQEYHEKLKIVDSYKSKFKEEPSLYNDTKFVLDYRYRQLDKLYMNKLKNIFDQHIVNKKYDIFETIKIKLPDSYDFAITSMIAPEIDLKGNILNDTFSLKSEYGKFIYLTIFPTDNKTSILISWLKQDAEFFKNYKSQILGLSIDNLKIYLNNLIPVYTTSIVLSPRLWEKQSELGKKEFLESFEYISTDIESSKQDPVKLSQRRREILKNFKNFFLIKKYDLFKL